MSIAIWQSFSAYRQEQKPVWAVAGSQQLPLSNGTERLTLISVMVHAMAYTRNSDDAAFLMVIRALSGVIGVGGDTLLIATIQNRNLFDTKSSFF